MEKIHDQALTEKGEAFLFLSKVYAQSVDWRGAGLLSHRIET